MSLKGFVKRTVKKTKRILNVPTKGGTLITDDNRYYKPVVKAVTKSKSGKTNIKARKKALDKIGDIGNKDIAAKRTLKRAAVAGVALGAGYAYKKNQEGKTVKGRIKKAYKKVKDKMK